MEDPGFLFACLVALVMVVFMVVLLILVLNIEAGQEYRYKHHRSRW